MNCELLHVLSTFLYSSVPATRLAEDVQNPGISPSHLPYAPRRSLPSCSVPQQHSRCRRHAVDARAALSASPRCKSTLPTGHCCGHPGRPVFIGTLKLPERMLTMNKLDYSEQATKRTIIDVWEKMVINICFWYQSVKVERVFLDTIWSLSPIQSSLNSNLFFAV